MQVDICSSWAGQICFNGETGRIRYEPAAALTAPSNADIWIVRHAETFANQKKILQGSDQENEDTVLSPEGEAQAEAAADILVRALNRVDAAYRRVLVLASPARRAVQTAQFFVRKMHGHSPLACDYSEHSFLHEIRFGEISGMTEEQVFKLGPEYIYFADRFRRKGDALIRLNGGESFHDLLIRVRAGFSEWQNGTGEPKEKTAVVIFTHMLTASALRVLFRDESLIETCAENNDCFVNWRRIIQNAECLTWDKSMKQMRLMRNA